MKELYRKYRPKRIDDFLGQDKAVDIIQKKFDSNTIPHSILLHGPYGTGKTTLAVIISHLLKCGSEDFKKLNSADYRGIDSVRDIRRTVNQAPMNGNVRVWLLDEVHKTTNDAQNAMLILLENPPDHAYFILATTEPDKLISGIKQRCLSIKLNPIGDASLSKIIKRVCHKERIKLKNSVREKLVKYAGGSAREALQILDKIYLLKSSKEQLRSIEEASMATAAIEIARRLINQRTKWHDLAPILKKLENEDPEQIRWMILGYGKSVLLGKDNPRAFRMIEAFRENFYDSKFAGVIAACYEIIQG